MPKKWRLSTYHLSITRQNILSEVKQYSDYWYTVFNRHHSRLETIFVTLFEASLVKISYLWDEKICWFTTRVVTHTPKKRDVFHFLEITWKYLYLKIDFYFRFFYRKKKLYAYYNRGALYVRRASERAHDDRCDNQRKNKILFCNKSTHSSVIIIEKIMKNLFCKKNTLFFLFCALFLFHPYTIYYAYSL